MSKKVLFLDTLGRTIVGVENKAKTTDKLLAVDNPAVLNIVPTQQGTMQVQIIPMVFREILADTSADSTWLYKRCHIVETDGDTNLSAQILGQYDNVTSPAPVVAPNAATTGKA